MKKQKNRIDISAGNYAKISAAIIIIGIVLRFALALIYHPSGDACYHFSIGRFIAEEGNIPFQEPFGRDEPFWAPPLFHFIIAVVYSAFAPFGFEAANFAIKLISPAFGAGSLILAFLLARRLYGAKTAMWSVFFYAFLPLSMDYGIFGYVDGILSFFVLLSVYLMVKGRILLSSIAAGLAILTKYNGGFVVPVLIFIAWKRYGRDSRQKELLKHVLLIMIISSLIGLVWFARNWLLLGNPVWPFFNSIFDGFRVQSFANSGVGSVNILNLFDYRLITTIYLGVFGVPDGNINTLNFLDFQWLPLLFAAWLAVAFFFIFPLIFGFAKGKYRNMLMLWVLSFLVLAVFYVINSSVAVSRLMLPAFPAIAIFWAIGIGKLLNKKNKKFSFVFKQVLVAGMLLASLGFIAAEAVKLSIAAEHWDSYSADFEWIRQNTPPNSVFLGAQCLSYNINRQVLQYYPLNLGRANYVFANKKFNIEPRSIIDEKDLSRAEWGLVYSNKETGTKVYKSKTRYIC
ncbi:glycosyltransferase family 39 protein [Candidatus Woesearchaeota archaeon]|nr:glycosyltransferase family 39 protein [Candidatus Woesearchaeota archaeon]